MKKQAKLDLAFNLIGFAIGCTWVTIILLVCVFRFAEVEKLLPLLGIGSLIGLGAMSLIHLARLADKNKTK